ncbi:MAG: sarcosine oxidase subunit gamma [Paracoccaceae bacterium]
MAEIRLTAAPILGADLSIGENTIRERDNLAIVSVATPLGEEQALTDALKDGWGLTTPVATMSETAGEVRAIRTTPDQILMLFPHAAPDANAVVQSKLSGAGYTTDQTDVWIVLELSGPDTLPALERLCPLDVHGMSDGASARTVMEHMGALILRLGPDRFWLLSASSSARSFLHAVETSYHNVS